MKGYLALVNIVFFGQFLVKELVEAGPLAWIFAVVLAVAYAMWPETTPRD